MNEIYKNGEGYADPTAYKAICLAKGVKAMNDTRYKRGDVVEIATMKGNQIKKGLVVQQFGSYIVFLNLIPERPAENPYNIRLDDGDDYWTDLGKVAFAFMDNVTGYYDRVDSSVLEATTKNLAICLGLAITVEVTPLSPALEPVLEPQPPIVSSQAGYAKITTKDLKRIECDLVKAQERASIFEGLYKELLLGRQL